MGGDWLGGTFVSNVEANSMLNRSIGRRLKIQVT